MKIGDYSEFGRLLGAIHSPPGKQSVTCGKHGAYESMCYVGSNWTRCPMCELDEEAAAAAAAAAFAAEEKRKAWLDRLGQSAIPQRFVGKTFDSYVAEIDHQARALERARGYVADFAAARKVGRSMAFVGGVGTGKTHLACAIGQELVAQGYSALYTTVQNVIMRVRSTWNARRGSETELQAMGVFIEPDLLILDEVGVNAGTDNEKAILFNIMDSRYNEVKPSILMSNLPHEEFKNYLGVRVMDRLAEGGGAFYPFGWDSWRRRA